MSALLPAQLTHSCCLALAIVGTVTLHEHFCFPVSRMRLLLPRRQPPPDPYQTGYHCYYLLKLSHAKLFGFRPSSFYPTNPEKVS